MSKCSSSLNIKTISITWCKAEPAAPATKSTSEPGEPEPSEETPVKPAETEDIESQKPAVAEMQTPEVSVSDVVPALSSSSAVHSQDENSESNDSIANLVRTATNNLKAEEEGAGSGDGGGNAVQSDNENANDNSDIFDMLFESKEEAGAIQQSGTDE